MSTPFAELDPKLPILLLANHCSWWDGFFLARLQREMAPDGALFTVMLESQLRKFPLFRKLGVLGIDPKNPVSIARTFASLKKLTENQTKPVFIGYFPQGEICPQFEFPLNFKPGVELLVRMVGPLQILPVAIAIEPMTTLKPSALIFVGKCQLVDFRSAFSAKALEATVEDLLKSERPKFVRQHLASAAQ